MITLTHNTGNTQKMFLIAAGTIAWIFLLLFSPGTSLAAAQQRDRVRDPTSHSDDEPMQDRGRIQLNDTASMTNASQDRDQDRVRLQDPDLCDPDCTQAQTRDRTRLKELTSKISRENNEASIIMLNQERDRLRIREEERELEQVRLMLCTSRSSQACLRYGELEQQRLRHLERYRALNRLNSTLERRELRLQTRLLERDRLATAVVTDVDDQFVISWDSNISTGYSWQADYDTTMIRLDSREYVPSNSTLVGAHGQDVFRFTTLKSSITFITFRYVRSWEPSESADTRVVRVVIRP